MSDRKPRRRADGGVLGGPLGPAPPTAGRSSPYHFPPGYETRPVVQRSNVKRTHLQPADATQPTYWTTNQWGVPARPHQSLGKGPPAASPEAKRAAKHYQRPGVPQIQQPDSSVFSTLNDLEVLMKATLGALANFNEDEKMLLTRQCQREEEKARGRGEFAPPGLINVTQFRHVWKKFGVKVSEEQAHAFFIKFGHDSQGLLPYAMFATKLLSSPARLLALEPEQKGPYRAGRDATFKGKILYRYCRKPVFPPSNWDGSDALRSAKKPKAGLKLEHVYGYAGKDNTANNLFWTADGKIVYYIAALGVVYDPQTHVQTFFQGHNDDIKCMAIHPDRCMVATGQVASATAKDGCGDPCVCVWDTRDVHTNVTTIKFPPSEGQSSRFIVALGFSGDGERLVVVTGDNRHTTYVYHWRSKTLISANVVHNGQPPAVYGVVWNDHIKGRDEQGNAIVPPVMFVTYGVKHMKLWTLARDQRNGQESYVSQMFKFGKLTPSDVLSACFISADTLVTGSLSGELLVWDVAGRRRDIATCIQAVQAHGPGVKGPSIHDGQMVLQGVRGLCLRANNTELVSGGSDGQLMVWDVSTGDLLRLLKTIQFQEVGESTPCSFRSLDNKPGSYDLVVGTNRCEIWEVARNDNPEPLIQGHTEDVHGCAWHPKTPHKFATACDSSSIFLWNARRRQLIAKVNIGIPARSVAFSPEGVHLAIGTATGVIKVLMADTLSQKVAEMSYAKEDIHELKYSPDGTKLAAGSHDNSIDIFNVTRGYMRIARCQGHSSYITHVDWSLDSRIIQSTCGAYELLYFDCNTGKQVQHNQRDTQWGTWTCTLGFPVMGIWRRNSDGTDINACCRSFKNPAYKDSDPLFGYDGQLVVTSSDDGRVRLFNYPCVVNEAPHREYIGHCSHVINVRFSPSNRWVLSVGGRDRSAMQWRVVDPAEDEVVAEKQQVDQYAVYAAPRRLDAVEDPFALIQAAAVVPLMPNELKAAAAAADAARQAELERLQKGNARTYEVTTVTSDLKGAGCNARVFLVINGSKRASGELKLENGPDNFARGRTDKFSFELQDLGTIDRLVVGHDGSGSNPRWHLDKVIIVNKSEAGSQPLIFPCNNWFAKDVGDGQMVRTLKQGGATGPTTRAYKIVVKTSDVKGAGTDANVFCTLFGEQDGKPLNSGPIRLENNLNNFERGQSDVFNVQATIGELKYIKIGHDNTGVGPSWHLQDILITSPGMKDMQFVANRWLASDTGDNQTYCILYPNGTDAQQQPCQYRVVVYTSDIRGAGTDARVFITMFGNKPGLDSTKLMLENSKNNFERGQEDIFFVTSPPLGDVPEVEIEHDNSGVSPGWHCEQVVVIDESNGKRYAFPCDRWLSKDEDDGLIRRRLKAAATGTAATTYRVTIQTSDVRGAGTDANVYLELCGRDQYGKEQWGPRQTLDTSKNNFERGKIDTFLLKKHKNLGELMKIRIGHDSSGLMSGWHLDHAEVIDDASGNQYYFPCNKWFDKKEGDRLIERILEVAPKNAHVEKATYKITVHTSDIKFAGTDANCFIQLFGEMEGAARYTDRLPLNNSKNNFERAQVDVFNVVQTNVGQLKRILIGHDNTGAGPDWHLKMVEVLCVNTGQQARFYHNGWLSKTEPPYKLEVELFPQGEQQPALHRYTVITYTSDVRGAGTDANVSCIVFGDQGQTASAKLENSKNNFERGQRDEFIIESVDVGTINKLQIGHDDSGLMAAWHLSHVEVISQVTGQRAYFLADQWLDKKLGSLTLTLQPSDAKGSKQMYKVSVQTGDVRGAGTDCDISLRLFGSKGETQELKLESSADNFERNKLDEFKLDLAQANLGDIQKIEIGFATQQTVSGKFGALFGQQWYCSSVEVIHMNTGARTFFLCEDWVNNKKRRVQLVPGKVSDSNVYKVVVRTSDIRGAGTDAGITLAIFGEQDGKLVDTGFHKLDNSTNNFERGSVDSFYIKAKDVGAFKRVQVASDGTGVGAAWHCDQVEVTDTVRSTTVTFPCGRWLDPSEPSSLDQTLLPRGADGEVGSLLQYEVTVYTSDIRGAGTDSNIAIEIWGVKDHTAAIKLETSQNNFERGAKDVFKVQGPDVGDVSHVVVKKGAEGLLGSDWHLQSVEVWHPALQKRFFFICSDWLKGACERKLESGKIPEGCRCSYRVLVTTSDIRGAGTDANVTMTLYGAKGDSGARKLDSSQNDFERGKVDTFFFEAPDLGSFTALRIGHDNSGFASAWHLAKVEVVNTNTGEQAVFPCQQWLDKEHGLEMVLNPDRDADGKGDAGLLAGLTDYTITVYTSDMRGAGTDANVFIELVGDKGAIGEQRLDSHANNFERGQKDVFKVKCSNVGDIKKVILRHDNTGLSPDWHCQQVEVFSAGTNKTYFFPCNAWLKKDGADVKPLSKELVAGAPDTSGSTNYRVTVYTSDTRGAGTDADVGITIFGDKGDTGERKLDNTNTNNFERGKVDTFFVPSPNVGAMQSIKLRTHAGGLASAWHLAKVEVASSATGETLVFPFNKWFDKSNGVEHVLWPDRDGDGAGDVSTAANMVKYHVAVYTSDIRGAGTDANVTIELHGDKGVIGATKLDNNQNNFERGRKDEFEIVASDVGALNQLVIGHDNSGLGSAWHLSQVEVTHPGLNQTFVFPCQDWLQYTTDKGVDSCMRTLKTGAAAAADGLVTYRVLVKTSDVRGAGTDGNVFITMYGPKGDSGEREIASGSDNFERNKLDTFIIKAPDLGDLERIKLRCDGGGLASAWHLATVQVISSATNNTYTFPFNNWFDSKNGQEHVIWKDGVQGTATPMTDYTITVYTSDIKGAGTDANVFIELVGSKGAMGLTRLESHQNNFERGQVDTFVVKGTDIGDVTKAVISHDGSGLAAAWHCQQVEVFSSATKSSYYFPCNAWLEKGKDGSADGCRKELVAGASSMSNAAAGQCEYKIEVKTGDVRGAGTDAEVSICVYGDLGDTGMQKLETSRNNFERNQLDTFFFRGPDIGKISGCKVVCSGPGLSSEWFLDYVAVTNASRGAYAKFPHQAWFDGKNGGWSKMLTADGEGTNTLATLTDYQVTVMTSDVRGAGTDGEVFLALTGDKGAMGESRLESSRSNFSRNSTDVFTVSGSDIGDIKQATVRLAASGLGAAWHLANIEVLNKKTGKRALFTYNNWLEVNKDNPKGVITLHDALSEEAKANQKTVEWKVVTQTGNMFGAGTDAPVYIQIWGPSGMLGGSETYLDNSKNNFEQGATDTFVLQFPVAKDCGTPVSKLVIERGKTATLGADWNLDWISVTDMGRKHTYKWRCNGWFNDKEGLKKEWVLDTATAPAQPTAKQGLTLIEAPAGILSPASTGHPEESYRLTFKTSDKMGAGTDADVRVRLTDTSGKTWQPSFPQEKSMYERGKTDEVIIPCSQPLNELSTAIIWLENTGMVDAWHMDSLQVTHLPSQRRWLFDNKNWLPKEGVTIPAKVVNDVPLRPVAPPPATTDTPAPPQPTQTEPAHQPASTPANQPQQPQPPQSTQSPQPAAQQQPVQPLRVAHEMIVYTGDKLGAGTDATVSCELVGTTGRATRTFDKGRELFEKGKADKFNVQLPDCGELQSVKVWHDGKGAGSEWFIDKLITTVTKEGQTPVSYQADFGCWIKGGQEQAVTKQLQMKQGAQVPAVTAQPQGQGGAAPAPHTNDKQEQPQPSSAVQAQPQQQAAPQPQQPAQPASTSNHPPPPDSNPAGKAKDQQASGPTPPKAPGPSAAPAVLDEKQFKDLLTKQRQLDVKPQRDVAKQPVCDWQKHTQPLPQDHRYMVTFYHNIKTGESTYEKPEAYSCWEQQYAAYLMNQQSAN